MRGFQKEFIELALEIDVLKFGEFELKPGRVSPYFFNSGLFNSGYAAAKLGHAYAAAVVDSEDEFYQCGVCGQIFWPGRKYDDKMNGLKNLALNDEEDVLLKDAVHKFRVSPPPR